MHFPPAYFLLIVRGSDPRRTWSDSGWRPPEQSRPQTLLACGPAVQQPQRRRRQQPPFRHHPPRPRRRRAIRGDRSPGRLPGRPGSLLGSLLGSSPQNPVSCRRHNRWSFLSTLGRRQQQQRRLSSVRTVLQPKCMHGTVPTIPVSESRLHDVPAEQCICAEFAVATWWQ